MSILFQVHLTFLSFQLAREMSLLGNYETASVYYQGVVQQVTFSEIFTKSNVSQTTILNHCFIFLNPSYLIKSINIQIHRLLGSIDDPVRKMKWQQIQGEVRHA